MLYGIVTAFADSASISGKLNADCACIEIDEASARRAFPHFKPNYMVLTNLFRDQLDRYGEIDITMDVLKEALAMSPNTKLIVNGDDPLSVALAKQSGNPFVTFGVDEQVIDAKHAAKETKEGRFCQMCGAELQYDYYHYSQLGKYHCPKCDFARPKLDYAVTNVHLDRGISLRMEGRQFRIKSHGFYNVYNILAAYAAARTAGFYLERFDQVLRRHKTQNGRMELFDIGGRHVVLNLAKNPAGFNQNISAVLEDKSPKDLIVVINDKAQDGKDISWLWDVDFERFHDARVQTFIASGIRALDMQLRFKYADIPSKVEEDVTKAIERLVTGGTGNLYVLCNYTALYNTHLILKKLEEGKV